MNVLTQRVIFERKLRPDCERKPMHELSPQLLGFGGPPRGSEAIPRSSDSRMLSRALLSIISTSSHLA